MSALFLGRDRRPHHILPTTNTITDPFPPAAKNNHFTPWCLTFVSVVILHRPGAGLIDPVATQAPRDSISFSTFFSLSVSNEDLSNERVLGFLLSYPDRAIRPLERLTWSSQTAFPKRNDHPCYHLGHFSFFLFSFFPFHSPSSLLVQSALRDSWLDHDSSPLSTCSLQSTDPCTPLFLHRSTTNLYRARRYRNV